MDISVSGIGVLDKAMTIVSALETGPRSLTSLVSATGLPRATAHRLATALATHGLVRRDEQGRFALGYRVLALSAAVLGSTPLRTAARPALEALRDATGESVQLFVRDGERRVCIEALEALHELRTIVPVGAALPLELGSGGRALRGEAATARHGWVESVEEREVGVASVSAPVCDPAGRVVAAVSVSGPIERTTRSPGRRYGEAVVAAARRVEHDSLLRQLSQE